MIDTLGRRCFAALSMTLPHVTDRMLPACQKLKVVGRTGIGYDVIDVPAATRHNVVVCNVPSYCEDEVSGHAMALLLSCVRRTVLDVVLPEGLQAELRLPRDGSREQTMSHNGHRFKIPAAGPLPTPLQELDNTMAFPLLGGSHHIALA